MKQEPTTLATGAEFNESTWNDFSERPKFHCRGKGVSDHYTRDAIFVVREKIHTYGYDEDRWLEVKAVGQNTIKIDGKGCLNT